MNLYTSLQHIASDWWAALASARTERLVGGLPLEIQKDIGWPDAFGRGRVAVKKPSASLH